jgi:hypothetical protein
MRYIDFRDIIQKELLRFPEGATWADLRDRLALPYERPCPAWTRCLEEEIGLVRAKGEGRALLWKVGPRKEK